MHGGEPGLPDGVRLGEVFADRYLLDGIIGSGAMGVVVAGYDLQLAIPVAIKFLVAADPERELLQRFLGEARAAAQIDNPHVVRVFNVASHDDHVPYIVMERLWGQDLSTALRIVQCFPVDEAIDYILQACEGVARAHRKGIIHRDLKPANLFRVDREDDRPILKVLDFGVAKLPSRDDPREAREAFFRSTLTGPKAMLGSPCYMSPEQMRSSGDVDAGCDIWALGVTLYELVVGERPYRGADKLEIYLRMTGAGEQPWRAELRDREPRLVPIVARCLEVDVALRYPSVAALARDLAPLGSKAARDSAARIQLGSVPPAPREITASPGPSRSAEPPAQPARSRLQVTSVPAVIVALLGAAALVPLMRQRSPVAQAPEVLLPSPPAPVSPPPPPVDTSAEAAPPPVPSRPSPPAATFARAAVVPMKPVHVSPKSPSAASSGPTATATTSVSGRSSAEPAPTPAAQEPARRDWTNATNTEMENALQKRNGTPR